MKFVNLDGDHRNILKCYSGKRIEFNCWIDDHHGWKEMDYFDATRIQRIRIKVDSQPNWWRVAEKGIYVLSNGYSYKLVGVVDNGNDTTLHLLNEEIDITIKISAKHCVIDFEREGLSIYEEDVEAMG